MEIRQDKHGAVTLLRLTGRLDANTSTSLEETLRTAIDGGARQFAIDCEQLDYISSAGLRVLLSAVKRIRHDDGKVVVSALQTHVKEVFDLAGFSSIFPAFPSAEEAVESFA